LKLMNPLVSTRSGSWLSPSSQAPPVTPSR
jgi:hypothetical protein